MNEDTLTTWSLIAASYFIKKIKSRGWRWSAFGLLAYFSYQRRLEEAAKTGNPTTKVSIDYNLLANMVLPEMHFAGREALAQVTKRFMEGRMS